MGSEEAEILGKAVLTNQFISGLHPEQKSMLAGQEASFDQLLGRTHFEEATQQEFPAESDGRSSSRSCGEGSEWRCEIRNTPKTTHWVSGPGPIERSIPKKRSTKKFTGMHFIIGTKGNRPNMVLHLWSSGTCA